MADFTYDKVLHQLTKIRDAVMMDKCIELISKNRDKFETAPASKTYYAYEGGFANYTLLCLRNGEKLYEVLQPNPELLDQSQLTVGLMLHHIDSMNRYIFEKGIVKEVLIPSRAFMLGYIAGRRSFDFYPNLYSACVDYEGPLGKMIKTISDLTISMEPVRALR